MSDELVVERAGSTLHVTFNRPAQHNALTWPMYDGLLSACDQADSDDEIRVMVLRGAGGKAFVAGTDIAQFAEFTSGDDGVAYEERISRVTGRLETVRVPTVAVVDGYCVGGGLLLAAICDLRVATPAARFGAPIARTLGNCLSMNSYAILAQHLGPSRSLDMLLRARNLTGEEAHAAGFVSELCTAEEIDGVVSGLVERLAEHAPLTMWASREALRRLRMAALPDGDDLVRTVFGSEDFRRGVQAFVAKQRPEWIGR